MSPLPSRTGLLARLDAQARAAMQSIGQQISIEPGRALYTEGDDALYAYTLENGLMMLERLASDGARQVMSFVFPGDFMGIGLDGKHMVTASVLKPSIAWRYPAAKLSALMQQFPQIESAMRHVTNRVLSTMLDQLCVLGRMTARERLIYLLLHLADREGRMDQVPVVVDVPMTRLDMADFLGLTIETVSRTITQLKKEGTLRLLDGNRIALPNPAAVEEIAARFRVS
jgi:CRP/FNR family transcriptional regulator, anaerobic regulatory protein